MTTHRLDFAGLAGQGAVISVEACEHGEVLFEVRDCDRDYTRCVLTPAEARQLSLALAKAAEEAEK